MDIGNRVLKYDKLPQDRPRGHVFKDTDTTQSGEQVVKETQ